MLNVNGLYTVSDAGFCSGSDNFVARNHSGAGFVKWSVQGKLDDVSCSLGRVACCPCDNRMREPAALPPLWIIAREVTRNLKAAGKSLANSIRCDECTLTMINSSLEELHVLRIQFAAIRAFRWKVRID